MKKMLALIAAGLAAAGLAASAHGQDYPTQNIKVIISFGPGGGSDIIGRIVAQRLQEKLGQTVVVENRAGAGGLLGNEAIAN
jgi:tripartite-type tricarboxylate transporter receptor subunit TctC